MNIAIIEDHKDSQVLIKNIVNSENYDVNCFSNYYEISLYESIHAIDLFILSQYSPEETLSLIRYLRNTLNLKTPILLIPNWPNENFIVKALQIGVDTFITKPYSAGIFLAKVNALLRRTLEFSSHNQHKKTNVINLCDYNLNKEQKLISLRDTNIKLTPQEFNLSWFYFSNINETISRQTLINNVFSHLKNKETRILDSCTTKIRKKLQLNDNGLSIETVHKFGYRLLQLERQDCQETS